MSRSHASLPGARALVIVIAIAMIPAGPLTAQEMADTLSLDQAIQVGLERRPEIGRQEADVHATAAEYRAGWGAYLPQARLGANFGHSAFSNSSFPNPDGTSNTLPNPVESQTNSSNQSLSLSWEIFRGGQRAAEMGRARHSGDAATRRLANTERVIRREVKVAYFEALEQQGLVEVAQRQLESRRQDLEVARRRYEIAAVNRTDVLGAEIELSQAELTLVQRQNSLANAQRGLLVSMGIRAGSLQLPPLRDVRPETVPTTDGLSQDPMVAVALGTKPEITALESDVAAASDAAWSARTDYLPSISLGYTYARSETLGPSGGFFTLSPSNTSHNFSLSASWNLFDGFSRESQTARAKASLEQSRARLSERQLSLEQEVRTLVSDIQAQERELGLRQQSVDLAQQRVSMMQERYRLGTVEYTSLLAAIAQLTQTEQDLITARYSYLQSWAQLEEQVGDRTAVGR